MAGLPPELSVIATQPVPALDGQPSKTPTPVHVVVPFKLTSKGPVSAGVN